MSFVLGTAQFSNNYGISRKYIISNFEVENILNYAFKNNINTIDTAMSYGLAEAILGNNQADRFKIITKIGLNECSLTTEEKIYEYLYSSVKVSLKKLNINKLYGLLLHDENALLKKNGFKIYNSLEKLKRNGLIDKYGVSFYSSELLLQTINNFKIDIIQFPFNLIDQRLIKLNLFNLLNYKNIEIYTRSSFLQGLFFLSKDNRPKYFKRWASLFNGWDEWLVESKFSPLDVCLSYVAQFNNSINIIIGVESSAQLKQIVDYKKINLENMPDFSSDDQKLINPSLWRISS